MAYWLDDGFDSWPEVVRAGTAAVGLYTRCGAWLARNIANGRLQDAVVPREVADGYGTAEWRQRLVDAGLWAAEGEGFRDLHHFTLNPTAEKVRQNRAKKAAAGRKGGLAKAAKQTPGKPLASATASATPVLRPPSLPLPSTREGREDAWPEEDPRVIAASLDELRQQTEEGVLQLQQERDRRAAGAAAIRQLLAEKQRGA